MTSFVYENYLIVNGCDTVILDSLGSLMIDDRRKQFNLFIDYFYDHINMTSNT